MKKVLLIMVIVLIPTITLAENPDSRPSLSLGIGSRTISDANKPFNVGALFDAETFNLWGQLKVPRTENITIHVEFMMQSMIDSQESLNYRAVDIGIGVTFYIGQSINK